MDYLFLALGLGLLLLAADLLVDSSVAIAQRARVSNFIIGLTIVGMGTSSPELFVSISSALSGSGDVAMGNVVGSNIANILLILGLTALISPMQIGGITMVDLLMMLMSIALVWLFSATKLTIARWEGAVLTALYVAYLGWLISQL